MHPGVASGSDAEVLRAVGVLKVGPRRPHRPSRGLLRVRFGIRVGVRHRVSGVRGFARPVEL